MRFDWKDLKAKGSPPPLSEAGKGPAPLERVPEIGSEWRLDRVLLIVVLLWMGLCIGLLLVSPLLPPLSMEDEERCPAYSDLPLMEPLCVAAGKVALIVWPLPAPPNPEASTVGPRTEGLGPGPAR